MTMTHQTLLSCPGCGNTGVARWMGETRRQCDLQDLSSGFVSIDRGNKTGHYFACQRCRRMAVENSILVSAA